MTRPADRRDTFPVEERATLTVEQAAKVLGIGRRLAYELANRFEETGGAEGLPVIRLGRCLRVPKARLEAMLAAEPTPRAAELRRIDGGRSVLRSDGRGRSSGSARRP